MKSRKGLLWSCMIAAASGICCSTSLLAQADSASRPFSFQAYAEAFYAYDFNEPADHLRPSFIYNFNRHDEVNVNFAMVKGAYSSDRFRANLALGAGTYVNANYAAEPDWAKHLYEANAGVKLMRKTALWLDAGVFSSHIGYEGAVGKDNYTLTRSLNAEGTPYYESGIKLGYTTPDEKWYFALLYLNGWQHISRPKATSSPAFGTQVTFKASSNITVNSSSFIGNELPDSLNQLRLFHNLFGTFQLSKQWSCIAGFDIGWQRQASPSTQYDTWWNPTLILRYQPLSKFAVAGRMEYFSDKAEVINKTADGQGFDIFGWSCNVDWRFWKHAMLRTEFRGFNGKDAIFSKEGNTVKTNNAWTTSLAVWW